jgi:putative FmdB family regulatory protein
MARRSFSLFLSGMVVVYHGSMPTYEYDCTACQHVWELEQSIKAEPEKRCPACGGETARRLVSGGMFVLQGGGWFADGYSKPVGGS